MKVKTFYPKKGKPTLNYADRKTPLTKDSFSQIGNATIQEIPADTQIFKLKKSADKTERHIKKLIQRKGQEPSRSAYFEAEIRKHEQIYNWKMTKVNLIRRRQETQNLKEQTKRDNLKKEMKAHIKNLEKIRPIAQRVDDKGIFSGVPKAEVQEKKYLEKEKRVGNKIIVKRHNRFSRT